MKKKHTIMILTLLVSYVGVYLSLSQSGTYMPFTYGANGIKDWTWTPRYFADDSGRSRIGMFYAFMPLYWLDSRYWHNDWTGLSGPRRMPALLPKKQNL